MSYSDEEKQSLYNTPVTELEIVDINNLVPNTLYLYRHNDGRNNMEKAVVEFINLSGKNRNYVVGKTLTDRHGNLVNNEFIVDPYERDQYKFYKRANTTGLHMSYLDEEKHSLYNTPVSELKLVDINNLVPNTLYLYQDNDGEKAVVEFIKLIGKNRNYVVGKTLTDSHGNLVKNEFMVPPSERDYYRFYKREHPAGLHEEIERGIDLKDKRGLDVKGNIKSLSRLAYEKLILPQKDDYHSSGTPLIRGGLKRKTIKRNRKSKRSRLLRGKTKTKTKTRKQK